MGLDHSRPHGFRFQSSHSRRKNELKRSQRRLRILASCYACVPRSRAKSKKAGAKQQPQGTEKKPGDMEIDMRITANMSLVVTMTLGLQKVREKA